MPESPEFSLSIQDLRTAYERGEITPTRLVDLVVERIAAYGDDAVWIDRVSGADLKARAAALEAAGPDGLPLYGIPFAIKDNIDAAGRPTTAGCPKYAYTASANAPAVQALLDAGAILIGKTNLDQFATGLVGVRSPYGVPGNSFDPAYVPGGSSSGSAVAVAAGLVSFSYGTDTAGSGRVPAAFNNIVGLKATKGLISTRGVVPACRSLDVVSVFALTADDAAAVLDVAGVYDPDEPFSRQAPKGFSAVPTKAPDAFRFGVPRANQLEFFGNAEAEALFAGAVERMKGLGGTPVEIDFDPFLETARLLYEGPWVDERRAAVGDFIAANPDATHPVTRRIVSAAEPKSAVDAYNGYYRLKALQRITAPVWDRIDVLLTPTAGTIYTIAEVEADPFALNANLGYYTNYMNLLDLAAVAIPAGFLDTGLPFGVTLCAPAFSDALLLALGDGAHRASGVSLGATGLPLPNKQSVASSPAAGKTQIAVVGAHLSGMPLNHQLTDLGANLVRATRTAPSYTLYAIPETTPPKPGLVRSGNGHAIELEVWEISHEGFGIFIAGIPAPLGIGTIELEDGSTVQGFLCEAHAVDGARDVSEYGGWRAYMRSNLGEPNTA
jgi:allophanate hydrolase